MTLMMIVDDNYDENDDDGDASDVMTMMFRISIDSSRLLSNPSWRCSFPIETRRQTIGCAPWGHRVYTVQRAVPHKNTHTQKMHNYTNAQEHKSFPIESWRQRIGCAPSWVGTPAMPYLGAPQPYPGALQPPVPKAPLLCSPVHNPLSLPSTPYLVPLGQGRRIGGSARR